MLDVEGELGEVEDLRDSGAGDAGGAGDLGLVFDLAGGKQVVKPVGLSVIERLLSVGSCSMRVTSSVIRRLRSPVVRWSQSDSRF